MHYAIVDIETTGGYAAANGITEIAILIHDGKEVIQTFETLLNPGTKIPYYISGLTGITDSMVKNAPSFSQVAAKVYELLNGNIFIAHSVNFDYSFLRHALAEHGYTLNSKKLCTVRLSRKIIPGLQSYSLGNICGYLDISIKGRHRAMGDAAATVLLFEHLLANDAKNIIPQALNKKSKEQTLPPNLPKEEFERLPQTPGVYYFHDKKGKVVYVGKAVNIKKRVSSHFSNNSVTRQKQNFLREVYHLSCKECGTEANAFAFETFEIKRLWPKFNHSQKWIEPLFGVVEDFDQNGIKRLGVQKLKSRLNALACFNNYIDAFNTLKNAANENNLCLRLSGITKDKMHCVETDCICNTLNTDNIAEYNTRVKDVLTHLKSEEEITEDENRMEDTGIKLELTC